MFLEDWIDHRPGGLDRVLAGEERSVAGHGVAQEPLVGRFLSRLFFDQIEFSLIADELLACALDASGEGDSGVGREPEAQIVGRTGRRRGVGEKSLRRRLQLHQNFSAPCRPGICRSADTTARPPSATSR